MSGDKKIMIIGEAPGRSCKHPGLVPVGSCGDRLSKLMQRPWSEVVDAINLLAYHQDLESSGSAFPRREAAAAAGGGMTPPTTS